MGLERIAAVLQGKHDNYDIDLMRDADRGVGAGAGVEPDGAQRSHRVIADHLRASFLIADGVLPSNEGRGYVLRRIMRRAMRHAHMLGARDPLMCRLVPDLVREMGKRLPGLRRCRAAGDRNPEAGGDPLQADAGPRAAAAGRGNRRAGAGATLDGEVAFKLYDTSASRST